MFIRIVRAGLVAAALTLATPVLAGESDAAKSTPDKDIVVFTVDVAEDLGGRFVPTFVKPITCSRSAVPSM